MKLIHKTLFAACAFFGMSSAIFAYEYNFTNKTALPIDLKVMMSYQTFPANMKLAKQEWRAHIVNPGETVTYRSSGLACLNKIEYMVKEQRKMIYAPDVIKLHSHSIKEFTNNPCQDINFTIMKFQNDIILVKDDIITVGS